MHVFTHSHNPNGLASRLQEIIYKSNSVELFKLEDQIELKYFTIRSKNNS